MKQVHYHLPFDQKTFVVYGSESDQSVLHFIEQENGYYEAYVLNLLQKVVKPDFICLDIGANIGTISLALSYLAPQGKVYAFEPSAINYPYLVQTIAENGVQNIEPLKLGVYNCNANLSFHEEATGGGWSHIDCSQNTPADPSNTVTCVRLDDWIEARSLNKVDLLKVDVEGSEIEVLQGAQLAIQRFHPDLIVEFNPESMTKNYGKQPIELYNLLESLYTNIYLIKRDDQVIKIADLDTLLEMIKPYHGDLYCTNKMLPD